MTAAAAKLKSPTGQVQPAVIILGVDEKQRPHASWFTSEQVDQAKAAAKLMGMACVDVDDPALSQLAPRLPQGKLFGSGKAFVPFCSLDRYDELLKHVPKSARSPLRIVSSTSGGKSSESTTKATSAASGNKAGFPADWSKIVVGSTVLATVGRADGWWEVEVIEQTAEDTFTLKWCDFPREPTITRHRTQLALMHPGAAK